MDVDSLVPRPALDLLHESLRVTEKVAGLGGCGSAIVLESVVYSYVHVFSDMKIVFLVLNHHTLERLTCQTGCTHSRSHWLCRGPHMLSESHGADATVEIQQRIHVASEHKVIDV